MIKRYRKEKSVLDYLRTGVTFLFLFAMLTAASRSSGQSLTSAKYGVYDTDRPPVSFFKKNRQKVLASMPDSSCLLIYSAPGRSRNGDQEYRYRQDDDFWYLTGCDESDALLLLSKGGMNVYDSTTSSKRLVHEILFVKDRNPSAEQWTGKLVGPEGAKEVLGVEWALSSSYFNDDVEKIWNTFMKCAIVYCPLSTGDEKGSIGQLIKNQSAAMGWLQQVRDVRTPGLLINTLRQVKSPEEIALIRKAVDLSVDGHRAMMRLCRDGLYEYQLQAAFESAITAGGAEYVSYPSIVGSGNNSTILHYDTNRKLMQNGEVVVLDCGAEYHNYAADITRTLPVSGSFSKAQRAIYEIVLRAQNEAIAMMKPGVKYFPDVQAKASSVIRDGLLRLGIISDSGAYTKYFMHGLGHTVGLDVHDVKSDGPLRPGEVWTVEPGIYISQDAKNVDEQYRGIGIRIEDDVLITADGAELLSAKLPRDPDAIEKAMKEHPRR
jgi:Xaa-Pro aminopeptidase